MAYGVPYITPQGVAAARDAANNGLTLRLTHMAIGSGLYDPAGRAAMAARRAKATLAPSPPQPTEGQLYTAALFDAQAYTGTAFDVGEVGFYAGDPDAGGVLFAVVSWASRRAVFSNTAADLLLTYTLALSAVPSGSVTVQVDPNASIAHALVAQHVSGANPHSQYVLASKLDELVDARISAKRGVGSVEIRYDDINPATIFGGTWSNFGSGRMLVGLDSADPDFNTIGKTGGAKTHTLTIDQIPAHGHSTGVFSGVDGETVGVPQEEPSEPFEGYFPKSSSRTGNTGGGQPHPNVPPYIVVRFWRRTA